MMTDADREIWFSQQKAAHQTLGNLIAAQIATTGLPTTFALATEFNMLITQAKECPIGILSIKTPDEVLDCHIYRKDEYLTVALKEDGLGWEQLKGQCIGGTTEIWCFEGEMKKRRILVQESLNQVQAAWLNQTLRVLMRVLGKDTYNKVEPKSYLPTTRLKVEPCENVNMDWDRDHFIFTADATIKDRVNLFTLTFPSYPSAKELHARLFDALQERCNLRELEDTLLTQVSERLQDKYRCVLQDKDAELFILQMPADGGPWREICRLVVDAANRPVKFMTRAAANLNADFVPVEILTEVLAAVKDVKQQFDHAPLSHEVATPQGLDVGVDLV